MWAFYVNSSWKIRVFDLEKVKMFMFIWQFFYCIFIYLCTQILISLIKSLQNLRKHLKYLWTFPPLRTSRVHIGINNNWLCSNIQWPISRNFSFTQNFCLLLKTFNLCIPQADSHCSYFSISWTLMERHWFYFFVPSSLVQGLRSLEHQLLQKLSIKNFDQKFRFFIKK